MNDNGGSVAVGESVTGFLWERVDIGMFFVVYVSKRDGKIYDAMIEVLPRGKQQFSVYFRNHSIANVSRLYWKPDGSIIGSEPFSRGEIVFGSLMSRFVSEAYWLIMGDLS